MKGTDGSESINMRLFEVLDDAALRRDVKEKAE